MPMNLMNRAELFELFSGMPVLNTVILCGAHTFRKGSTGSWAHQVHGVPGYRDVDTDTVVTVLCDTPEPVTIRIHSREGVSP